MPRNARAQQSFELSRLAARHPHPQDHWWCNANGTVNMCAKGSVRRLPNLLCTPTRALCRCLLSHYAFWQWLLLLLFLFLPFHRFSYPTDLFPMLFLFTHLTLFCFVLYFIHRLPKITNKKARRSLHRGITATLLWFYGALFLHNAFLYTISPELCLI